MDLSWRRRAWIVVAAACLAAPTSAWAQSACSARAESAAQNQVVGLKTWGELHAFFVRHAACRDGATVGEGVSDVVVRLFASGWSGLPGYADLARRDPKFERFALSRLDMMMSPQDAATVRRQATRNCPRGAETACRNILSALAELDAEVAAERAAGG